MTAHILMTGGSGQIGRFVAERLVADGHRLMVLGRRPADDPQVGFLPWDLSAESVVLPAADALVHCALDHVPGRYRGGEGDDPHGFVARNVEGTNRLFEAAKVAGIGHCVFLSSRAVYADTGNWAVLPETAAVAPDTLYGQAKLAGEDALAGLCDDRFFGTALRVTGVYGQAPGLEHHKWTNLFQNFDQGAEIAPRVGTEVHGADLAEAIALVLDKAAARPNRFEVYNVSDLLLDRQDLLKLYAEVSGCAGALPQRAAGPVGVMEAGKLKVLGWRPGGLESLKRFITACGSAR